MSYLAKARRHARRARVRAIAYRRQDRRIAGAARSADAILRTFA